MEHSQEYYKRVRKKKLQRNLIFCIVLLLILLFAILGLRSCAKEEDDPRQGVSSAESSSETVVEPKYATIGVTGDIMVHSVQLTAAKQSDGSYDFNNCYEYVKQYYNKYDLFVANLEVTFGTSTNYTGYPTFNCPASLADAIKNAGIDLVTTANNHAYDTGHKGFVNTMEQLKNIGIPFIGTRQSVEDKAYIIKDINGINVGMTTFTYATTTASGNTALNGISMTAEDSPLVNSFEYNKLESFYEKAEAQLNEMKSLGADAAVIFMHWGNEYKTTPNSYQTAMAQRLADMGYDVIVGGHPHVIQPFAILEGKNGNKTYCIYSMGNSISNQRKELMDSDNYAGRTEDGMIFGFTLKKDPEGITTVEEINIIPTWVDMFRENGRKVYRIVALDKAVSDWQSLGVKNSAAAKASHNRTVKYIGTEYNTYRTEKGLSGLEEIK